MIFALAFGKILSMLKLFLCAGFYKLAWLTQALF